MSLTRDQILAAALPQPVPVSVPEWGGDVYVRAMSGAERDAFEVAITPPLGKAENVRARLVVICACDAAGAPLFAPGDVATVGALDARALDRVAQLARKVNALGGEEFEAAAKN